MAGRFFGLPGDPAALFEILPLCMARKSKCMYGIMIISIGAYGFGLGTVDNVATIEGFAVGIPTDHAALLSKERVSQIYGIR